MGYKILLAAMVLTICVCAFRTIEILRPTTHGMSEDIFADDLEQMSRVVEMIRCGKLKGLDAANTPASIPAVGSLYTVRLPQQYKDLAHNGSVLAAEKEGLVTVVFPRQQDLLGELWGAYYFTEAEPRPNYLEQDGWGIYQLGG